jgi:hypothetical protein
MLDESDTVLSAKCKCESAADCTCKKGACDCKKCNKHHRQPAQVMQKLSDSVEPVIIQNARYDASAGVFI